MAQAAFLPSGDFPKVVDKSRLQAKNQPKVGRKTSISADLWSEWRGSNSRPPHPKEISQDIFCLYELFSALSARKTALFGAPQSTVSEYSETVSGQLCGRKNTPQAKILAWGACCWWYVNSKSAKSQVFFIVKI